MIKNIIFDLGNVIVQNPTLNIVKKFFENEHKDYGSIEEKVRFIGTRYWIESFKWSGAIIVGE